jgi:hypothetical protein
MSSPTEKVKPLPLPDLGDIIFIFLLQLVLFWLPYFVFGDGSSGWHIATGQYILKHMSIPQHDIFSYTFAQKPWVAYEWLSDCVMALIVNFGGLNALAVAVSSAVACLFLMLYEQCRKAGGNFLISLVLTLFGAIASSVHWLARPHIFTWFGVLIFAGALENFYRGRIDQKKLLLTLCLTMLVWVNVHPAFIIGFAMTGIYLVCLLLKSLVVNAGFERQECLKKAFGYFTGLLALIPMGFLNPYGGKLYQYILHYLQGTSTVLAHTDEFSSPVFHLALQPTCLEILFFALATGLVLTKKKPSWPQFMLVMAFCHLALSATRNVPVFVVVALPFIAELWSKPVLFAEGGVKGRDNNPADWWQQANTMWQSICQTFDTTERRCTMHLLPALVILVLMASCLNNSKLFGSQIVESGFDPAKFPTTTLNYIVQNKLNTRRGFNYDNWGGYINYSKGIPVFIDDRADFYGEPFYLRYAEVSMVYAKWAKVLDDEKIDWVLFPANSKLVDRLKMEPGWKLASQDKASCLFVRASAAKVQ